MTANVIIFFIYYPIISKKLLYLYKKKHMKKLILIITLILIGITTKSEPLKVGLYDSPPFVMMDVNGSYTGLIVDIWERIAKESNIEYVYEIYDGSINGMVDELSKNKFDIILGSITISDTRMDKINFSQPFYITDLSIASNLSKSAFWSIVSNIFSLTFLKYVLSLLLIIFIVGILIWLVEHKYNPDFDKSVSIGIYDAFYFATVVMSTVGFGDKSAKTKLGKLIVILWMLISLGITSVFIGNISSAITVNRLDNGLEDINQLNKTKVGSFLNTTAVDYLNSKNIKFIGYDSIEEALNDLECKNLETFVYDTPILKYYIKKNNLKKIHLSNSTFDRQYYGIGMKCDKTIENNINKNLIKFINSDLWDVTLAKYNLN
jgi:ABC-type amino acid transport substrate-binding protein